MYQVILDIYICHLADAQSYPERLTGAIRVKCLAQEHIDIFSSSQLRDSNQQPFYR